MKELTVTLAVPVSTLVLIGGGEFSFGETRHIDATLLSRLQAGRKTVAFLPTASGSAEYAAHLGRYFREIDPDVETVNVPVYRGRDARRTKNAEVLLSAGMIYVGGGVSNNVLGTLPGSPVEAAMREAAAAGTLVVAIGAAASCFGTYATDPRGITAALPALGWLAGTVVDTGFDSVNDVSLRRLMSLPDVKLGLGIPAGTALLVNGDGTTDLIGEAPVAAYRKG